MVTEYWYGKYSEKFYSAYYFRSAMNTGPIEVRQIEQWARPKWSQPFHFSKIHVP